MATVASTSGELGSRRRGQLFVALAALAWSSAGVLQRELSVGTATQVAGRALFALIAILVYVATVSRGGVADAFRSIGRPGIVVAVCTAVASGSFIVAINHTTVANVIFMQAVSPIVAAFIARVALHERISRRTGVAMVLSLIHI